MTRGTGEQFQALTADAADPTYYTRPLVTHNGETPWTRSSIFSASKIDVSLMHYTVGTTRVFLLVYVDDIIMMGNDPVLIDKLLQRLSTTFKIWDLGTPSFFLGIETLPVPGGLILSQRHYMSDLLKRANMTDCKPLATPASVTQAVAPADAMFDYPTQYRQFAGALQYLTITRPDLSYVVNSLCQCMHAPTVEHWGLLKRVLRYVKGTTDLSLRMSLSPTADIHAFSDFD
ncbi:uncharacterized protein LOC116024313 [Ipomoea triloba]|uniref:uncharacterized protein LOC116024313 n=1 Tax=Ipomoea triloba TaxID=35885 RepID=UPI00125E29F3|nr:uncharacterized protein LOC116024313 [Ipomoea triloba]